jgi:hypothetical protein
MPKTLREQIENNLMFFFLATLIAGFLAGVGAYRTILEIAQLETISRRDLQELRARNDSPASLPISGNTLARAQNDSTVQPKKKLLSCSLRTVPNATPTNVEAIINSIHDEMKVRPLSAIESGKPISQTPSGTYSYISGVYLTLDPKTSLAFLSRGGVRRLCEHSSNYELINLSPDSIMLMAFAGSSEAAGAAVLDGTTPRRLTLFPWPSSEASVLLVIPLERILESSERYIQPDTTGSILVLDVVLN